MTFIFIFWFTLFWEKKPASSRILENLWLSPIFVFSGDHQSRFLDRKPKAPAGKAVWDVLGLCPGIIELEETALRQTTATLVFQRPEEEDKPWSLWQGKNLSRTAAELAKESIRLELGSFQPLSCYMNLNKWLSSPNFSFFIYKMVVIIAPTK